MPIKLINVQDLFGKNFIIPHYQRGYRWDKRQVEDFLKDIWEFQRKLNKEIGEFYCFQPIVVKKLNDEEEKYELIDGQQRLTTLYLLLIYFKNKIKEDFSIKEDSFYILEYETRKNLYEFLKRISIDKQINTTIIDFYYLRKAWEYLKKWIDDHVQNQRLNKSDYLNTILKKDIRTENNIERDVANNVRFIWYEVDEEENGQEIFTRINRGKIPLTNAELIKALFFIRRDHSDDEYIPLKRALEWESIENKLHDEKFWFFLNSEVDTTPTRIEFIFDLIAEKYKNKVSIEVKKSIDKYFAFYIFNELITNRVNINGEGSLKSEEDARTMLWEKVMKYFHLLEEWYNDYDYYHLIGYLVHTKKINITELIDLYSYKSKMEFRDEIKRKIKTLIFKNKKNKIDNERELREFLNDLSYDEDSESINKILLLFNILLSMKTGYVRFPFDLYIKNKWSLEHIHAQNSEDIKKETDRKRLLKEQIKWIKDKNPDLISDIEDKFKQLLQETNDLFTKSSIEKNDIFLMIDETTLDDEKFKCIENHIFKYYTNEHDEDSIHSIDNLTLLSISDNSALKNNIFPIKRDKIIEMDKNGHFIPIATKNVFLKYFSRRPEDYLKWNKADREDYYNQIIETFKDFFNIK